MAGPRVLLKGCQHWHQQADSLPVAEIVRMYDAGFAGAYEEPEELARFRDETKALNGGLENGSDIAHAMGWAESGAGKLILPFLFVEEYYPGSMPGPAQERGDCVSHGTKNAALVTLCCEIKAGVPDEVTGQVEGAPEVPAEGIRNGVLSTEAIYWWRRHGGDGWSCGHAASVVRKESGLWLRKDYPELGVDLTRYSGGLAGKFGRNPPSGELATFGRKNIVRTATELSSAEELRDFMANGYAVSSCGGEGFASERDENGVAKRRGSWAHAMAYIGFDDRDETRSLYNGPLVLVLNSWGPGWIRGPRRIRGTQYDAPEGSFWARYNDVKNREMIAFSSVAGWAARNLPSFGFDYV